MTDTTLPYHQSVEQMGKEVITQVNAITVHAIRHELRKREINAFGSKVDLRIRLMAALRREYDSGWTCGYLLSIKIIPFNGCGRDPQTLVGRHVAGLRAKGSNRLTIMLSDGPDQTVVYQTSYSPLSDDDEMHLGLSGGLFRLVRTSSDESQTYDQPLLITEAATALCRNHQGKVAATIFGIKLEGMEQMAFFNMSDDKTPDHTSWAKLSVDICLAGDGPDGLEGGALFRRNDKPIKIKEWFDGVHYVPWYYS